MSPKSTLCASPSTDIWRQPPSTDLFSGASERKECFPLSSFQLARVTFSVPLKYRYDQGGLLLHLTKPGGRDKWLKTGVEFYQGKPFVSTVGCHIWADWSVAPSHGDGSQYTVEARRVVSELGTSLWVYQLVFDTEGKEIERIPLREVAWFFAEEEGWTLTVGPYAARPADLEVTKGETLEFKSWDFSVVHT